MFIANYCNIILRYDNIILRRYDDVMSKKLRYDTFLNSPQWGKIYKNAAGKTLPS